MEVQDQAVKEIELIDFLFDICDMCKTRDWSIFAGKPPMIDQ